MNNILQRFLSRQLNYLTFLVKHSRISSNFGAKIQICLCYICFARVFWKIWVCLLMVIRSKTRANGEFLSPPTSRLALCIFAPQVYTSENRNVAQRSRASETAQKCAFLQFAGLPDVLWRNASASSQACYCCGERESGGFLTHFLLWRHKIEQTSVWNFQFDIGSKTSLWIWMTMAKIIPFSTNHQFAISNFLCEIG